MSPLEKMARAIDPAAFLFTNDELGCKSYDHPQLAAYRRARAALLAIREPDMNTGLVGADRVNENMRGSIKADYCAAVESFTAMIDAILNQEPRP